MNRKPLRPPTVVSLPVRDGLRTIDLPLNHAYEGLESLARQDELSIVEDEIPTEDDSSELSVVFAGAHHSERPAAPDTIAAPPPSYPPTSYPPGQQYGSQQYPSSQPYPSGQQHPSGQQYSTGQYQAVGYPGAANNGPQSAQPGALHARSVVPGPSVHPSGRPITLPPGVLPGRPPPPPGKFNTLPPGALDTASLAAPGLPALPVPPRVPEILPPDSDEAYVRVRADSIVDFDDEVDTTVMPSRFGGDSDRPPVDSLRPVALPSLTPPPLRLESLDPSGYYAGARHELPPAATIPAPPPYAQAPYSASPYASSYAGPAGSGYALSQQVTGARQIAPARVVIKNDPPPRRALLPWIASATVVGGVALTAAFFLLHKEKGELVIDVADQQCGAVEGVQVFVDDELACTTSPCNVRVANGSHVVRAEAAGYAIAAPQAVLVDPETPTLHKVQFGATTKTGIEVRGKGAGLSLYLDGKLLGDLPKRVTGLSVGEHTLLVTGGEGFYAEERKINLKSDEMLVINDLELKPRMGSLHIASSEQLNGASVLLDGVPIRLPYDKELDASRRYHVQARRAGFDDFDAWVEFSPNDREKRLDIQFTRGAERASSAPERVELPQRSDSAESASVAAAEPRRGSRRGGSDATGTTRLNLKSDPPAMVLLDGKPIGQTPRSVEVEPGVHAVLFVHPTLGRARASAKLEPGQSKTLRARF